MAEPEQEKAPLAPLPEGYRYAYNRMAWEYEQFFDGKPIILKPHEIRMLTSEQAEFLRAHSLITGTLRKGGRGGLQAERAIALGSGWRIARWNKTGEPTASGSDRYVAEYELAEPEPEFLVPSTTEVGMEYFDRASMPNYTDRPTPEGRPTHVEMVRV